MSTIRNTQNYVYLTIAQLLAYHRFFPSAVLYGRQEPEPPSNPPTVTYQGPFRSDTEEGPAPPRSTTPTLVNAAVWASQLQPPLEGAFIEEMLEIPVVRDGR
jgi:hypothetical protein